VIQELQNLLEQQLLSMKIQLLKFIETDPAEEAVLAKIKSITFKPQNECSI
jgi:hypothetical protein